MKYFFKKISNVFGFHIVRITNRNFTFEQTLSNVLKKYEIGCIIDVGANTGQYGSFLRSIGYKGYIISFEPVGISFDKLCDEAQSDEKWRCFQYALGDFEECKEINVYKSTTFSSFLSANNYAKGLWSNLNYQDNEVVLVKRLDEIFENVTEGIESVNCMLKMDTQGYDVNVFNGALGILSNISVLQSEISIIKLYENSPSGMDVLKWFGEFGYCLGGVYPVSREESLAVIEFDCLLVKR